MERGRPRPLDGAPSRRPASSGETPLRQRPGRPRSELLVVAAAIGFTALRIYLAHRYPGFLTGDDVEIAQEAFRRAVGMQFTPWDVRSLLIPDLLVAPFIKLASIFTSDRLVLMEIARYPFIILAAINIILLYQLGKRWYGETAGAVAAVLYAAHWMPNVLGSSLYPRTVAVTCLLLAAILLERYSFLAGVLAALALTARYSEAIYFVSLLVIAWPSRKKIAGLVGGFATGFVIFVGAYDWLTWGRPFGSLIQFAELTFVRQDASSRVVSQSVWYYLGNLPHWLPLTALPLMFVRADRRIVAFVVLPVAALSAIFHKELRYLQVVVPFALLFAAHGFAVWSKRRWIAVTLVVLAIPLGAARIGGVTRRSTNAVAAAQWIAEQHPRSVVVSQAWAYGGRIVLGDALVIPDLPTPPTEHDLRTISKDVDYVALFKSDVPGGAPGLRPLREFDGRGGRAVVVYAVN